MAAAPPDEIALALYEQRVGQLTHYAAKPEFASTIAKCLVASEGFFRKSYSLSKSQMRGSFRAKNMGRSIEIFAADDIVGVLIADDSWQGNLESALRYDRPDDDDE